jgi:hypothetical protein
MNYKSMRNEQNQNTLLARACILESHPSLLLRVVYESVLVVILWARRRDPDYRWEDQLME